MHKHQLSALAKGIDILSILIVHQSRTNALKQKCLRSSRLAWRGTKVTVVQTDCIVFSRILGHQPLKVNC